MIIIRFPFVRVHNIYIYIYLYIYIYIYRLECPIHCKQCKRIEHIPPRSPSDPSPDNFNCLFCMPNYFLNSESICVSGGECGAGTYPDILSTFCEPCNTACDGCVGPPISDCLLCAHKYLLNGKSLCEERVCQSDEYIENKTFICKSMI